MIYSQETIDRACTANRVMYWDLSRHTVRVDDAIESQEYEKFKDDFEMTLPDDDTTDKDLDDFRLEEDDLLK